MRLNTNTYTQNAITLMLHYISRSYDAALLKMLIVLKINTKIAGIKTNAMLSYQKLCNTRKWLHTEQKCKLRRRIKSIRCITEITIIIMMMMMTITTYKAP